MVSDRMGDISPTAYLELFHADGRVRNADQLFELVSAMAEYENYSGLQLPREVFNDALELI
jgi:hypothetical protein